MGTLGHNKTMAQGEINEYEYENIISDVYGTIYYTSNEESLYDPNEAQEEYEAYYENRDYAGRQQREAMTRCILNYAQCNKTA